MGKRKRSLRLLSSGCRDERLSTDEPPRTSVGLGAIICATVFYGTRAGCSCASRRGCRGQRLAVVDVDAQVSSLGGKPKDILMAGELDRAGAEKRQVTVLQRHGE